MAAAAEAVCWAGAHSMPIMLIGSLIYAIGWLPSYVYSALMADTLDYIECEQNIRADGLTASMFTIVATISVGVGQGLFNLGLTTTGYEAPYLVSEGVYNTQNAAAQSFITFAYVGIPMICLIAMAIIMFFFKVELHLPRIHDELTARRKAEAAARGEVYMSPDEKAALEQAEQDKKAEEKRIEELKARCARKGLDFEAEEAKNKQKLAAKQAKSKK